MFLKKKMKPRLSPGRVLSAIETVDNRHHLALQRDDRTARRPDLTVQSSNVLLDLREASLVVCDASPLRDHARVGGRDSTRRWRRRIGGPTRQARRH